MIQRTIVLHGVASPIHRHKDRMRGPGELFHDDGNTTVNSNGVVITNNIV